MALISSALEKTVDALPESLRAVFVLQEVEGLSGEETAKHLGIAPENSRVGLHRAKAALQRHLDAVECFHGAS